MASKLKAISVTAALETASNAAMVGTTNLYTLPLEILTIYYATSVKGDKPKVIFELATPIKGVGTIQIFAPSYLTFDEQRAHLAEYFENGITVIGSENQPVFSADGNSVEGLFFKRYEVDGPNYEIITEAAALSKMKATGLNSNVMEFGVANAKLTREQINTGKNIQRGNVGTVAVTTTGGVMGWLAAAGNAAKNALK